MQGVPVQRKQRGHPGDVGAGRAGTSQAKDTLLLGAGGGKITETQEESVRAFIAIEIPLDVTQAMGSFTASLKDRFKEIRWVKAGGIHVTLRFLGNIPLHTVEKLEEVIPPLCAGRPPIDLKAGGLGAFPNLSRPRVVWLDLQGGRKQLIDLQGAIDRGCARIGLPAEKRPYSPHLTLGRVKKTLGREQIDRLAQTATAFDSRQIPPFCVTSLHLFRSELTPEGAVYSKLKTFPLLGGNAQEA